MVTSVNSVGANVLMMRPSLVKETPAPQVETEASSVNPAPGLASVVRELNAVVTNLARDMRVELDMGSGKLGARVISDSGVARPIPLEYVSQLATLLRQAGGSASVAGSQIDEIV